MHPRPRRSVLYMPGANPRALDKARGLPADCLILDLEDSVAPDQKAAAREQVVAALAEGGYGYRERVVRINALDGPWGRDDLQALAAAPVAPDAILAPKLDCRDDVLAVVTAMEEAGCGALPLWLMVETPACILNIAEVAAAHPSVTALVLGTSDLAKDTRVRHTPDRAGFLTALNLSVYAARANGLDVIDGVQLDLEDDAALLASCEQGRDLGFDGKSLIHPRQLEAANRVFAPDAAELAAAREIIAAFAEAQAAGKGVVVVRGRLVEALHVEEAQRQLALAAAIAELEA